MVEKNAFNENKVHKNKTMKQKAEIIIPSLRYDFGMTDKTLTLDPKRSSRAHQINKRSPKA